ncbi:MAG TPA: patatin-like phospholipase family protein [Caulobacteraceae bacterium]|nr:patatin-like phospholipase family protein [Caulobacteraceae bacterium]
MTESLPDTALTRLFEHECRVGDAAWFSLPGGVSLFQAGEAADHLYLLRTGRLGAIRREEGHEPQFLGVIRPGEPAGEMSLIAGAPHSANVVALRDSEILALPREVFFHAAETDPGVMTELARLMIHRARQTARKASLGEPSVFGFMGVAPGLKIRPVVDRIARAIDALGYAVTVAGSEVQHAPTEWFSNVEHAHDFVLYAAEAEENGWKLLVGRQVDRLFRVARGSKPPPANLDLTAGAPLAAQQLMDLILIQKSDCEKPQGSEAWVTALSPSRLFQMRDGPGPDVERMARVITGQSVGLVLSGGGARAYAHIGAINALHAHGVPVDFIGGVSMGAIIGAGLAMGWGEAEMERRIRVAFVETSPVDDIAIPLIAMTHGEKVKQRLADHFDDRQIADLWLPFFCVSSNLTTGAYQLHRRGLLRDALRASISLPGVLPPVTYENNVLVDGAVMKNFPADIMRSVQLGPIVGVDVSRGRSIDAEDMKVPKSIWRWILSGEWRKGPPIVSLLMRAATVTTGRDLAAAREATDVLILPNVDKIEIRDWKAYEPAVEAGRQAAEAALDKLGKPVTALRRRTSIEEAVGAVVVAR